MDSRVDWVHEEGVRNPEIIDVVPAKTYTVVDAISETRVLPELTKVDICCEYLEKD